MKGTVYPSARSDLLIRIGNWWYISQQPCIQSCSTIITNILVSNNSKNKFRRYIRHYKERSNLQQTTLIWTMCGNISHQKNLIL